MQLKMAENTLLIVAGNYIDILSKPPFLHDLCRQNNHFAIFGLLAANSRLLSSILLLAMVPFCKEKQQGTLIPLESH
jgi:hypothetical protein